MHVYLNIYASTTGGDLLGKELLISLGNDSDYEKMVTLDELDDAITRVWASGPIEIERAYRNRIRVTSPECSLISRSSYQRNKYITPGAGGLRLPKNGI